MTTTAKPWTRQLTGAPKTHRAYAVRDGRVIQFCEHNHRSQGAAWKCAEKLVRALAVHEMRCGVAGISDVMWTFRGFTEAYIAWLMTPVRQIHAAMK